MINRYQGNSGRVVRVEERSPSPVPVRPVQRPAPTGGLLPKRIPDALGDLETEDIILLLIVYLLYRETRDEELLIMLGAIALL